jgi:glutaredoxin
MGPTITLYTRAGCHLCEQAHEVIDRVRRSTAFTFEILDIDADPELRALYNEEVPVIAIDGRKAFKYRVTEDELRKKLAART